MHFLCVFLMRENEEHVVHIIYTIAQVPVLILFALKVRNMFCIYVRLSKV